MSEPHSEAGFFKRSLGLVRSVAQKFSREGKAGPEAKLDLANYDYYKEAYYLLQVADDERVDSGGYLKNVDKELKSDYGQSAHWLGDAVLFFLRERRINDKGEPVIVCLDEATDSQVLQSATAEDRKRFFQLALTEVPKELSLLNPTTQRAYITSSVVLGSAILNASEVEARRLIRETITSSNLEEKVVKALLNNLQNLSWHETRALKSYLRESPSNIDLRRAATRHHRLDLGADGPLEIGGDEYEVVGADSITPLSPKDEPYVQAFYDVISQGRQAMVKHAKNFASEYLGYTRDKLNKTSPPGWWLEGSNFQGLWGDEILVFIPYRQDEVDRDGVPFFIQRLINGADVGGWHLVQIPKDKMYIKTVGRLHD